MEKVYIVAAKRSAIGAFIGGLSTVPAGKLGAEVAKDVLLTAGIAADRLDEVIVGNILPAGCGQGVARQVAIRAGVPVEIPAWGVSMACGSGMKAAMSAAAAIASGSVENADFTAPGTAWAWKRTSRPTCSRATRRF